MIYGNIHAEGHKNNSLFANEDPVHRFNPTHTFRLLRENFLNYGVEINTPDINFGRQVIFDIYADGQKLEPRIRPRYLIALENPIINPLNADREYYLQFDRVFTWGKLKIKLDNTTAILIPHKLEFTEFPEFRQRPIFSCLINANKAFKKNFDSDLYLERLKTIRWHESHAPHDFELYGMGWEKSVPAYTAIGRLSRLIPRLKTRLLGVPAFPSFRGELNDKSTALRLTKFSYCYENSQGVSNYITEKIFDSFVSGCVPIYWGADNILEYIPTQCFIDRRNFKDTEAVYKYLKSITSEQYNTFQKNILIFLQSKEASRFNTKNFARLVSFEVISNLQIQSLWPEVQ